MKLALVAGVRPKDSCRIRLVVARDGSHTPALEAARLYHFTRDGCDLAKAASKALADSLNCDSDWMTFVWRVLVEGAWERPESVTPVWVIEGHDQPIPVSYFFD